VWTKSCPNSVWIIFQNITRPPSPPQKKNKKKVFKHVFQTVFKKTNHKVVKQFSKRFKTFSKSSPTSSQQVFQKVCKHLPNSCKQFSTRSQKNKQRRQGFQTNQKRFQIVFKTPPTFE
jgi:hypothetical protein